MIRNASRIWGYSDVQDINSFDPVLNLIFGALAEEIRNVSREIYNSDARIIEKLLDVLFSKNMFTHFAHAIANAISFRPRSSINEFYRFYFTKNIVKDEGRGVYTERKNIWFTPTGTFTIFNGEMKYLLFGKDLYEINGRFKDVIAVKSSFEEGSCQNLFWVSGSIRWLICSMGSLSISHLRIFLPTTGFLMRFNRQNGKLTDKR